MPAQTSLIRQLVGIRLVVFRENMHIHIIIVSKTACNYPRGIVRLVLSLARWPGLDDLRVPLWLCPRRLRDWRRLKGRDGARSDAAEHVQTPRLCAARRSGMVPFRDPRTAVSSSAQPSEHHRSAHLRYGRRQRVASDGTVHRARLDLNPVLTGDPS